MELERLWSDEERVQGDHFLVLKRKRTDGSLLEVRKTEVHRRLALERRPHGTSASFLLYRYSNGLAKQQRYTDVG